MIASPEWTSCLCDITVPAARGDVNQETIDGQAILFDPTASQTIRLNETALLVWQSCQGQATLNEIATLLTERYDVDFKTAQDHTEQLVACFASQNLFEAVEVA